MFLLTDMHYGWLSLTVMIIFWFLRHLMLHRIGGTTGDTAGALVEIVETAALLASVIALNNFL